MTTDTASIRAELEDEQAWRRDEIRFLRNQLSDISGNNRKKQFRRVLIVMLYAHYEGFCKYALERYIRAVNESGISCGEATAAIVAGAWREAFTSMETGDKKEKLFKSKLPDDTRLHRFARRREFVERLNEFHEASAVIKDEIIDTESNLWPVVLQKNLYLVGLDHEALSGHDGHVSHLMRRRNGISHGLDKDGLTAKQYSEIESAIFKVMESVTELVEEAIATEQYRK